MKEKSNIFLRKNCISLNIIKVLNKDSPLIKSDIARRLNSTLSGVCLNMKRLEKIGIVKKEFIGKRERYSLTNKGKEFYRLMNIIEKKTSKTKLWKK